MTETPAGWNATTLGQIGTYVNGRGFGKHEWRDLGRPIIGIQNLTGTSNHFNFFDGDVESRYVVRTGDLLVAWAATLGAYFWRGPEALLNQHIFRVESHIEPRFHKYLLDFKLGEIGRQAHGSGMVHVTRARFESVVVAVPDRCEQRRIVDILEDHISRLDAATVSLRVAAQRLDGLEDRVVRSSLTGTAEPGPRFSSQLPPGETDDGQLADLPSGWTWSRLNDVADVVGGVTKDSARQGDPDLIERPYLRVANVQRGRLDLSVITTIRVSRTKAAALRLEAGDVLLNEGGDRDKLARGWVWEGQVPDCIHQNHVFRARIRGRAIDPRLVSWTGNTFGAGWAERNGKQSVNLASISLTKIRQMPVIVPPLEKQLGLVRTIEGHLAALSRMRVEATAALQRVLVLRRALVEAAFSGRLTGRASDLDRVEEIAENSSGGAMDP